MTSLLLIRFLILQTDDGKEEGSGAESGHAWSSLVSEINCPSHDIRGKLLNLFKLLSASSMGLVIVPTS